MTFILLAVVILGIFGAQWVARRVRLNRMLREAAQAHVAPPSVHRSMAELPDGYLVDDNHAWGRFEADGDLVVGADLVPLRVFGAPDRIELAAPGTQVRRGEVVAVLHKGDRELALRAPVRGTVTAVNSALTADPSRPSADPFGAGWMVHLRPRRPASVLSRMRIHEDALAWLRYEQARIREVLTQLGGTPAMATMQDGGVPVEGFGQELDDDGWCAFKDLFFDQ